VGRGNAATKTMLVPDAEGAVLSEGESDLTGKVGEGRSHPAGCSTTARKKRTTQEIGRPSFLPGKDGKHGEPDKNLQRAARSREHEPPAERHRTSNRTEVGSQQGKTKVGGRGKPGSQRAASELRRRGTG